MDAILDAIENIVDFVDLIYKFIKQIVKDTTTLIETVFETVKSIPDYFEWLPSEIVVLVVALFGMVVIYKVLGREG